MAASNNAGVDNSFRRKFIEKGAENALANLKNRIQEEENRVRPKSKGPPVQRKPLKYRDYVVDLESRLGKTQVVTPKAPLS